MRFLSAPPEGKRPYRPLQRLLRIALAAALVTPAAAAELTSTTGPDRRDTISLEGDIVPGDADRLFDIIKTASDAGRQVIAIRLRSRGGNLAEGLRLADAVRHSRLATIIEDGALCASSCFIVFAAGTGRKASHSASVGVHGASDKDGRETVRSNAATITMARAVRDLGVPPAIIGKMVVTPPAAMVWLDAAELTAMGVTMTGRPGLTRQASAAQQPPASQGQAPAPVPAARSGEAPAGPKGPQARNWQDTVAAALDQSRRQNGGEPRQTRTCQPEQKLCNVAIFYRDADGRETMVRHAENIAGETISRDVCVFNQFEDIRTCTSFPEGGRRVSMKDRAGAWRQVE
jgi:hypothetical protein